MKADVRVDMYPDKVFEGKVSRVDPVIEPNTRTFSVEITIPNGSLELRPGMFSRTTLNFGSMEGIMVEDIAVQKLAGSNDKYLFVIEDGKAVRRNVTTGTQAGSMINIVSGVNAGDQVVITGISRLENGTEVEVKN
jgi:RND family efflux transporter MFP subunit